MDAHEEALNRICGDMDDMESKKMFDKKPEMAKGVDITISVAPKTEAEKEEAAEVPGDDADDEMKMPPFLRKKK